MASFHIIRAEWRSYVHLTLSHLVDKSHIVSFQFNKNEFDSTEKEFVKNGHYYDVVKYETVGDSVKIYCFDDETETRLVSEFHTVLFENIAPRTDFQGKTQLVFQLLIKEYLFEKDFSLTYPPSVFQAFSAIFYHKKSLFLSPFLDCDSPPPQGILI